MNLLFLTNFYPPASRGGYEEWCQEVATRLRARGHDVLILTSRHELSKIEQPEPDWIRRELHLEMEIGLSLGNSLKFFTERQAREAENLQRLRHLVEQHQFEAALVWGMWNLPRSLAAAAESLLPGRVVYYLGDYWPTLPSQYKMYWQAPAKNWLTALPKKALGLAAQHVLAQEALPALQFEHILYPTAFMRAELERQGVTAQASEIVYGAIDTALYPFKNGSAAAQDNLTLLTVSRLVADKGVHTAIESLAQVVRQPHAPPIQLNIAGVGEPDYVSQLHQLVERNNLAAHVSFLGARPKTDMPALYRQADIFLFTSIWQEPFGRVLVEAMASGAVVVGTATGGAAEILRHYENGLTFAPDNPTDLARQILKLAQSPELRRQLARAGRQTALEKFDIEQMAGGIEAYLQKVTGSL